MARIAVLGMVVGLIVILLVSGASVGAKAMPSSPTALTPSVTGTDHPAATPLVTPGNPFSNGMPASVAILQENLTGNLSTITNASAATGDPEWSAMSPQGDLWVTDFRGDRVLEFKPPFVTGEAASVVIGQTSFTASQLGVSATNFTRPAAVAVDPHGDLWVSDFENSRVLEFLPPLHTGEAASVVLGQSSFSGSQSATSATNLSFPTGIASDLSGDLWVADTGNQRVVEFQPPFSNGMAASVVVGQTSFTGDQSGGATTANNLSQPYDVAYSSDFVWVADAGNNRVVGYATPVTTGEAAAIVEGQNSLTSSTTTGDDALLYPLSVMVDSHGDLWVSDDSKNRVVEFAPDAASYSAPIEVIGQTDLAGIAPGLSAVNLWSPNGAFVSNGGDLWVTDAANDRVLEYIPSTFTATVQETGLPAGTTWNAWVDGQSASGAGSLTFSVSNGSHILSVTPVAGYRADPALTSFAVNGAGVTETVLFSPAAPNAFSQGMAASIVIGQAGFTSDYYTGTLPGSANATTFGSSGDSYAAAFDGRGDLWVTDGDSNRVLEFVPPFTNGMAASLVLGQPNFNSTLTGTSATTLAYPDGLTFDSHGNLWVTDSGNNRVLEFTSPFSTGMAASLVVGQSNFNANTGGSAATNLSLPGLITWFDNALWVADWGNARVVEFPNPTTNGEAATLALGQSTLTGSYASTTAVNLTGPEGIAFDAKGDAWVADTGNNRVLEFRAPLSTGEAASIVLGESNFTTLGTGSPQELSQENSVWVDAHGNVWVADSNNNRVLEYAGPTFVTNQTPALVLGQGNLTTTAPSLGRSGLNYPTAALTDAKGNLWVIDTGNNRVLGYVPTQYGLKFAATGLPSGTSWSVTVNGTGYASSSGTISMPEQNGTYSWNTSVTGWSASVSSGTATVNGANSTVTVAFTQSSFTVTFTETGLPSGTTWSVTLGSTTNSAVAPATISFTELNGQFPYTIGSVSGYSSSGSVSSPLTVSGANVPVTVTFSSSTSSSSLGGLSTLDWILIGVVLAAIVVGLVVALARRGRGKGPQSASAGMPSQGSASPPPGASGPPPPPSGNAPPPGAMG